MAPELNAENLEDAVRSLLDQRIEAVRALAKARQRCVDKRAELAEAEREDAAAFAAAQRVGWSTEELKRVGLGEPGRRGPGRPRGSRKATPPPAPAAAPPESAPSVATQNGPSRLTVS